MLIARCDNFLLQKTCKNQFLRYNLLCILKISVSIVAFLHAKANAQKYAKKYNFSADVNVGSRGTEINVV